MSELRPPRRKYPLGVLGWSIVGLVLASLVCAVADPVLGVWLRDHSPATASPGTGQVVETVLTSRRGPPSAPFFVSRPQWWLWEILFVVTWLPLVCCLGALAWFYTLGRPRYDP